MSFDAEQARAGIESAAKAKHEPHACEACRAPILWAQLIDENGDRLAYFIDDKKRQTFPVVERQGEDLPRGARWKSVPIDFAPAADGNVRVWARGTGFVARVLKKGEDVPAGVPLRKSHFATCRDAERFRQKQNKRA